jgi:DNA-binding CsgD family transcriptional regulator
LRGRGHEREALERLLAGARAGLSSALVLRGEPGVGKTALLDYVFDHASGFQIARAGGVESEMELPFAGLQQLCAPMRDRLEHLPDPQRAALRLAFGLSEGAAPDRSVVGMAVLSLLSDAAERQPLVCLIDDVQWLDQASIQSLAFAARRLMAEPVALVFAVREPSEERALVGLPELAVDGLGDRDAQLLLASAVPGRLDRQVRDRIVAETRGNPLALLELPRGLTPAELAGGFPGPDGRPLASRIEQSFVRRLRSLPHETQQLLLIAAAEPVGDPVLLWRAAALVGISASAAAPAEDAGLLRLGACVAFRHPLVRSATYNVASLEERRRVHRTLAHATDPEVDPDRRAWHRAQAASGPDEDVAGELERSADRARRRGGHAAAAAFLERAVALTSDPTRRGRRALAAGQAKMASGAPDEALELLSIAEGSSLDEFDCARIDLVRAQIAFAVNRGSDAPLLLLAAAKRFEPLDVGLTRETCLEALWAAMFVGRLAIGTGLLDVARAARAAPPSPQPPRAADLLLDGVVLLITEGYAAGTPILGRALSMFRSERISKEEEIRWLHFACRTAVDLWDDEAWYMLAVRHVEVARDAGALSELPIALNTRIGVHLNAGEFAAAASLIDEAGAVTEATGSRLAPYGSLGLAAWEGREPEAFELIQTTVKQVVSRGEGVGLTATQWASAQLYNSFGRYEDALAAAQQAGEHPEELLFATWGLVELIEAATRSGKPAQAANALERVAETTRASGTDWALGIEARSRALVSDGDAAEPLYREAIDRLARTRVRVALARAHLVYGEWLRRERRRTDARNELRIAYEMFYTMGAEGFAERAERELLATGETARKRVVGTSSQLTAQEVQVARLARNGLSNSEIAARLFISSRTVQYHLRNVFTKLGITSRIQLGEVPSNDAGTA